MGLRATEDDVVLAELLTDPRALRAQSRRFQVLEHDRIRRRGRVALVECGRLEAIGSTRRASISQSRIHTTQTTFVVPFWGRCTPSGLGPERTYESRAAHSAHPRSAPSLMTRTDSNFANPAEGHADDDFGGVHDPSFFHDGCGVACVARLDGEPRHE